MATENLIEFGGDSQRSSDSEVRGVAQVAPGESSDIERRWSVITGAQRGARVLPLGTLNSWLV